MKAQPAEGTRITVGASSFADAAAVLRLIDRIMNVLRPRLGGILVEETASLSICQLPNQRVVSVSGQVVVAPTRAQVGTLIEADARSSSSAVRLSPTRWSIRPTCRRLPIGRPRRPSGC